MRHPYIKILTFLAALALTFTAGAQNLLKEIKENPDNAGGVYLVYHYDNPVQTPAPEGYIPFYISHYGRHGSRWLGHEEDYDFVKEAFDKAAEKGLLTPYGKDIYKRVTTIYNDATYRAGALTPLGVQQHREIAGRMIGNYPQVFGENAEIHAISTTYPRCILSMASFCERLKETNPSLRISKESDLRTTRILNFFHTQANPELKPEFLDFVKDGQWKKDYAAMGDEYLKYGRLMSNLFTDTGFLSKEEMQKLMKQLYFFAVSIQGTGLAGKVSLYDIFTPEELYSASIYNNYYFFILDGPSAINKGGSEYYARILLQDIIGKADGAINGNGVSADLRFGHDTSIMPFVTLLQLKGFDEFDRDETDPAKVAEKWSIHRLTPMATNIQFVFYRPDTGKENATARRESGDNGVLVKIMHNEHEMYLPIKSVTGPYYRWTDVRRFYLDHISALSYPENGKGQADAGKR